MKYLLMVLFAMVLAGCEPGTSGSNWVTTGRLEGASCGLVRAGIGSEQVPGKCIAIVRAQNPETTNAYDVEIDVSELIGKQVNVVRLPSSRHVGSYYRIMPVVGAEEK